jgi:hypothetical protein
MMTDIHTIEERVDTVIKEVEALNIKKADKEIITIELTQIKKDISRIDGYGRWAILLIGAALITAILANIGLGSS